eukprot:gene6163-8710_t
MEGARPGPARWAMGNGTYTGAPLKGIAVGNGCSGHETGSCGGEGDKYGE